MRGVGRRASAQDERPQSADRPHASPSAPDGAPILDPRLGDFESDHSAPKQRSLLAIAGSLIGEISLPKLAVIWTAQILAPAVLLGFAPLFLTAWIGEASSRFAEATEIGSAIVGSARRRSPRSTDGVPLFRLVERNFWSLNALAVQPGYAFWREAIRHLTERSLSGRTQRTATRPACARRAARRRASSCSSSRGSSPGSSGRRRAGSARSPISASPHLLDRADDREHDRRHVGLSRDRVARLGPLRRVRRPAARPRAGAERRRRAGASGASPISRTCTWSANATGSGSRAAAPARAATAGSSGRSQHLAAIHARRSDRPRPLHRRHDGRRDVRRMGRVPRHPRDVSRARGARARSCPATTTSTSSTAPIPPGSTCRSARSRRCAGCGRSRRSTRFRASGCGRGATALPFRSPRRSRRSGRRSRRSPTAAGSAPVAPPAAPVEPRPFR